MGFFLSVTFLISGHLYVMNREQAKAKIAADFNRALTGDFNIEDPNALPLLERILVEIGIEFTEKAKENLKKAKAISTGGLFDLSIPVVYQNNFGGYTLEVGYPLNSKQVKYFDYVNKGVRGTDNKKSNAGTPYSFKQNKKSVPIKPIQEWLKLNSDKIKNVGKYRKLGVEQKAIDKTKSQAFLMARGIHRKGLTATRYFDDALKVFNSRDFQEALSVALEAEVVIQINRVQKEK
jgi:hypothetical protein